MKKRVGLARALALDPELLFSDEPTSGLDPIMTAVVDKLTLELTKGSGMTAVVVTHDMTSAFRIATRMIMLNHGKIIAQGTPDEIRASPNPEVQQFINGEAGRAHAAQPFARASTGAPPRPAASARRRAQSLPPQNTMKREFLRLSRRPRRHRLQPRPARRADRGALRLSSEETESHFADRLRGCHRDQDSFRSSLCRRAGRPRHRDAPSDRGATGGGAEQKGRRPGHDRAVGSACRLCLTISRRASAPTLCSRPNSSLFPPARPESDLA